MSTETYDDTSKMRASLIARLTGLTPKQFAAELFKEKELAAGPAMVVTAAPEIAVTIPYPTLAAWILLTTGCASGKDLLANDGNALIKSIGITQANLNDLLFFWTQLSAMQGSDVPQGKSVVDVVSKTWEQYSQAVDPHSGKNCPTGAQCAAIGKL